MPLFCSLNKSVHQELPAYQHHDNIIAVRNTPRKSDALALSSSDITLLACIAFPLHIS